MLSNIELERYSRQIVRLGRKGRRRSRNPALLLSVQALSENKGSSRKE